MQKDDHEPSINEKKRHECAARVCDRNAVHLCSRRQCVFTFIIAAFGAVEIGRSTAPDGRIANCQLRFDTATIMVSEASAPFPPSCAALYLYVADADQAVARAIAAGAKIIMDVDDMDYGDRQGGIRDPSGNIWWVSQRGSSEPYF